MLEESSPSSRLGAALRSCRVRAGLTQQEVGRRAGVSVRTLRDVERGRFRQPWPASVGRLAAALGLDLAGLELNVPDPQRPPLPWPGPPRRMWGRDPRDPVPARLEVGVLGPLLVRLDGRQVLIGSVKQRLLLGALALHPGRVVRRDELADVLWGERPPRSWHSLIHTYVARLRGTLQSLGAQDGAAAVLAAAGGGYRLLVDEAQLDLLRFDALVAKAQAVQASDPPRALELFAQALGRWRGRVLADLPGLLDQHPAAVAVTQRRTATVLACADLALELGRPQQVVEQLRGLADDEPLHEGVHARLMLALAAGGQQAAALQVYADLRTRLGEELGIEPSRELDDAQARVLRGDLPSTGSPMSGSVTRPADRPRPAQLPMDAAAFTGRDGYLQELDALLPADGVPARIVATVITGMAGVGKTALAVRWAHGVANRFPDGQLWLDLHGYDSQPPMTPLRALAALLTGLGVAADRIPVEVEAAAGLYRSLLAGRRVLVVLDNARDADQVRLLLPGHPGAAVVITSRDRLTGLVATHGVHQVDLEVLTPVEAGELLGRLLGEDRVAAEPDALGELGRRCALLPLALRIAAANLTSQPGQTIAGYLAGLQAGDRVTRLAVDGDAHAAVRVAFDHSYLRLGTGHRRLLRQLGLAPVAEVSVPAAAALARTTPAQAQWLLDGLSAAHLVEPREPGRYGLHDLLRLYARQRAERHDRQATRDGTLRRLVRWYLETADAAARMVSPDTRRLTVPSRPRRAVVPGVAFTDAAGAMAWLEAERANLVAVVEHAARNGDYPDAWLLADTLRGYFSLRRHTIQWLAVAHAGLTAAAAAGDVDGQAAGSLSLGDANQALGRFPQAVEHYTAALTLARRAGMIDIQAICLVELGMVNWWWGNLATAADQHQQALVLFGEIGRRRGQAVALINAGVVSRNLGRLREAARRQTQALALARQGGWPHEEANALGNLGVTLHDLGRLDDARRYLSRALAGYQEVGERYAQTWILSTLAGVYRDVGRHPQALEAAEAAVRLAGEIRHRPLAAAARTVLADVHRCLGDHQQAVRHAQRALHLARQTRLRAVEAQALCGLAAAERPADATGHARQACAIATQAGMKLLEGQALTLLAAAHLRGDQPDQALACARRALGVHRQTGHRLGEARTLRLLGRVLHRSDSGAATRCLGEALELFTDIGSPEGDELRQLLRT